MPNSEIHFEKSDENNHLAVTINTERLTMKSVIESDLDGYKQLLGNTTNMLKFAYGESWSEDDTQKRVYNWIDRWENNNPFSSLAITRNDTEKAFIGHVILGKGEQPGSSELAYVFDKKYWGKGYGKESVTVVVQEYAPELINRNYKVEGNNFTSIEATSRPDNEASVKVLTAAGMMKKPDESFKFGHNRQLFFVSMDKQIKLRDEALNTNLQPALT